MFSRRLTSIVSRSAASVKQLTAVIVSLQSPLQPPAVLSRRKIDARRDRCQYFIAEA